MTANPNADAVLRALMADHGRVIYSHCVRVLGDRTEAADVLQQVFEQAYRDLSELREPARARSWLLAIATHRCLDAIKANKRRAKRLTSWDDQTTEAVAGDSDPSSGVDSASVAKALQECLNALRAEARTAILLRFQRGLTYEEMADACREKPATLQARVARALPALRRCLEARGFEE